MIPGKVAVILQARTGSQRLPGKVLASLASATLLEHCVSRLQASGVGPVIVATTTLPADDVIAAEARRLGVTAFRGSCDDVLDRFVRAADAAGAEFVIRATADNPAVDFRFGRPAPRAAACIRLRTMPWRKACPMGARLKQSQPRRSATPGHRPPSEATGST